jgi:methylthioribulose-1-phosphate dehydratase
MLNSLVKSKLSEVVRGFYRRGWADATGTNYSLRNSVTEVLISRSGIDKEHFSEQDLIKIDLSGQKLDRSTEKTSAETLLHTMIYQKFPAINCVLHTHSTWGTVLSRRFVEQGKIDFENFEMQKVFPHVVTHEQVTSIRIFPNSQNISALAHQISFSIDASWPGFLLAGHGLYAFGKDLAEAKRHTEGLEFLLKCRGIELSLPFKSVN